MARVPKLLQLALMLALACSVAGLYGALHNQVSYTISPEYFTALKFQQFGIGPDMPNRLGAALVGVLASWWMGLVIGLPLFAGAALRFDARGFFPACRRALTTVIVITVLFGLIGWSLGVLVITPDNVIDVIGRTDLTDPIAYAQAGILHDAGYLGGLVGMLVAAVPMLRRAG